MKLSKKVVIIFTICTIMTIFMYIIAAEIILNATYSDNKEVSRITGISGGVANRINGEQGKLIGEAKEFASLIRAERMLQGMYSIDAKRAIGLDSRLKDSAGEIIFTLEGPDEEGPISRLELETVFKSSENSNIDGFVGVFQTLLEERLNNRMDKAPLKGIIELDGKYYMAATAPIIDGRDGRVRAYVCIVSNFDEEFIKFIETSMGREEESIKIFTSLEGIELAVDEEGKFKTNTGEELKISYSDEAVISFKEMEVLNSENSIYVSLKESLVIKRSMSTITNKLTLILAIVIALINVFICIIVERVVVKRIVKINNGVNGIRESKRLSDRIDEQDGNDEISVLSKDINYMINALEDSNNIIFEKDKKYEVLLNTLTNGYMYFKIVKDEQGVARDAICIELNDATLDILKLNKSDIQYKSIASIIPVFRGGTEDLLKTVLNAKDNSGIIYVNNEIEIVEGTWGSIGIYLIEEGYFACIITDITKTKRYADDMKYLANYDVVTTLLNRYSLYNRMDKLIYENRPFTIYFIDLDNFKNLNDTLGHSTGDEVLCGAASALLSIEGENITVGRLGGDEFLIIKEGIMAEEDVVEVGKNILSALNQTFKYKNYTYELRGSIGASSYPENAVDMETLLKYADIAMYNSKKNGGNKLNIISSKMLEEILIEAELKEAINKNEFKTYYQPIYNIEKNKIIGAEALIRWVKDDMVVEPNKFVPIAKRTGDIVDIDNLVLREACIFSKSMREKGYTNFQVSINASYLFLKQLDLKKMIVDILKEVGLQPSGLKLEITEDEVLDEPKYITEILTDIKSIGIEISLDDFGVGYSSFNHIKMLPIDTIKIDRSLLLKVNEDNKSLAIIKTVIKLAHTLNLDVVCEGVEDLGQLELLKSLKCDKIQGYYISEPVKEADFEKVMKG